MGKSNGLKTKLFPIIVFSTILFAILVPLGTLIHELFHLVSAFALGCDAQLHHSSIDYQHCQILNKYCQSILGEMVCLSDFLITLAGPLGTLIVSLTGLWLLTNKTLGVYREVLAVALSLFHLRITANAFVGLLFGRYSLSTDETVIAGYLHLNEIIMTILVHSISLVIVGLLLKTLGWKKMGFYFLTGLSGFIMGYFFYFRWLPEW